MMGLGGIQQQMQEQPPKPLTFQDILAMLGPVQAPPPPSPATNAPAGQNLDQMMSLVDLLKRLQASQGAGAGVPAEGSQAFTGPIG